MSTAYLVEVDDTKQGVVSPTVVGPFVDAAAAGAFAEEMGMGEAAQNGQGGYSEVHVVSAGTCDYSPAEYREEFAERSAPGRDDGAGA